MAQALVARNLVPVTSADEEPVAVIQGYGPDVGWRQLAQASLVIGRGLPWVATNLDATIPTPRGRVLGNGALVAALRHACGVEPLVAGKPEPPLMLESVERTGARQPVVVGDRLDTDIEGATRSGLASLLVLTGVTDWPELCMAPAARRPTYLDRDLRGLLETQPEVPVRREADTLVATCRGVQVRVPVQGSTPSPGSASSLHPDPAGPSRSGPVHTGSVLETGAQTRGTEDPAWWLSAADRPAQGARSTELDVVRAAVTCAWRAMDAHLSVVGPATVRHSPG